MSWLRRAPSWARRRLAWILLAIVTVVAVVFGVLWWGYQSDERSRDEIESVAQDFILALTNFSADTIDEDVEEIQSFAVGGFADEVDRFFGDEAVTAIEEAEATSLGEIEAMFVQDIDQSNASVFALVSETVTNASLDEPQSDMLRLEVELIETTSGWKVENVEVIQAPGGGLLGGSEAS